MDRIERKELKEKYPDFIKFIQASHKSHPDVEVELFKRNKPVRGLTHTRGYFILWKEFYIHYVMAYTIIDPNTGAVGRAVEEMTIYESFQEYEVARLKELSSVSPEKQEGLNLN